MGMQVGEVVFNTAMTGYQELLTDPSYHKQIVVCTVPHVGNVGVNPEDPESNHIQVAGFGVRALSQIVSNWRARATLDEYLRSQKVIGVSGIETRALVRHLRTVGVMRGVIAYGEDAGEPEVLVWEARRWSGMDNLDLAKEVTCKTPYIWEETTDPGWYVANHAPGQSRGHIVAYDFGIKTN